ncbi:Hypothetical predicted protein [Octopus vulgaris]|uniref:Uncharacterized protein n=1 Tax=Octopus vulgaris TaxID=6645 RepID=A0AA36B2Z0_OCTVU|nr:Hypothetical predicted protein [Octopus vulgaris]
MKGIFIFHSSSSSDSPPLMSIRSASGSVEYLRALRSVWGKLGVGVAVSVGAGSTNAESVDCDGSAAVITGVLVAVLE